MAEWTTVARTADAPEGAIVGVSVEGEEIVLLNVGGSYRALGATCTHAGCNLAEDGELEDGSISCSCHGSVFDLESGEVTQPPAREPLPVHEVRVEDEEIQVALGG